MFFMILLGIGLIAVGVGATFGGAWATVGAVVLLAIGIKVLFMGTAFGFFRHRARARWHRNWGPGEDVATGEGEPTADRPDEDGSRRGIGTAVRIELPGAA